MTLERTSHDSDRTGGSGDLIHLTRRELEVLAHIAAGRTNRQIATALTISLPTAERHVHNILAKLNCSNRTEAAVVARKLIEGQGSGLAALAAVGGAVTDPSNAVEPYPGLRAFGADDGLLFFGREEAVARALGRLESHGMVTVVGASGSGKSSLVRAGLVHALRSGALPGSSEWTFLAMTPGSHPIAELAAQLSTVTGTSPVTLLHDLESDVRSLDIAVRQLAAGSDDRRVVLVLDQLEELFTMCHERQHRDRFVELLLYAATMLASRFILLVAVRADFYGECAALGGFADLLESTHMLLGPPSQDDLRAAIEMPAEVIGVSLEPGLTDRILADIGDAPGALPLLSHALRETWLRREGNTMTRAGYRAAGGTRRAIAQTADRVFQSLTPTEQDACRDLFVRLTELRDGIEDTRRRVRLPELLSADDAGSPNRELIRRLGDARLLTIEADSVEVVHEALIREWPRLRQWLDDDRDGHRIVRHLTESAQSWDRMARDSGELYRGLRLATASDWVDRHSTSLNPLEREFLTESLDAQQREQREAVTRLRRLRVLVAGLAILILVAVAGASFAVLQRDRASSARDRAQAAAVEAEAQKAVAEAAVTEATLARLETEIPLLMKSDRSLAFVLAAEAFKLHPSIRTGALLNLVHGDDPRYLGRIWPVEPVLANYGESPDGKYLATVTTGGLVELHDLDTRSVVATARGAPGDGSALMEWADGGSLLVTAALDSATETWELIVLQVPSLVEVERLTIPSVQSTQPPSLLPGGLSLAVGINGMQHVFGLRDGSDTVLSGVPWSGSAQFDPLGRFVASQPSDAPTEVRVYDAHTYELLRTLPRTGAPGIGPAYFTAGGNLASVSSGPAGGHVDLWDPATGELLGSAPSTPVPGFAWFSTSTKLAVFPLPDGHLSLHSVPGLAPTGEPFSMLSTAYSAPYIGADDERLYSWNVSAALEYWDLTGEGLVSSYTEAPGPGEAAPAPDGTWFVKQSPDGSWSRWSLPGLALIDRSTSTPGPATLPGGGQGSLGPVVSSDGQYFATAHSDCPAASQLGCGARVIVWDARTGAPVGEAVAVPNPAPSLRGPVLMAFHPDLPVLAIAGPNNTVRVVTIDRGALDVGPSFTVPNGVSPFVTSMAFVPSALAPVPTLITFAGASISAWDVASDIPTGPALLWEYDWRGKSDQIRAFAISRDGFIALAVGSGALEYYRLDDFAVEWAVGDPAWSIPGVFPLGKPVSFAFSSDERLLSLRTADGSVAVWDIVSRQRIGSSFAPQGSTDAWLLGDSALLVSSDSSAILWKLDTQLWATTACLAAGRNLTHAEWTKYFPGRPYEVTCDHWPADPHT